jgi:hypothetical protein
LVKDEVKEVRRQQRENKTMKRNFAKGARGSGRPRGGGPKPGGSGQRGGHNQPRRNFRENN